MADRENPVSILLSNHQLLIALFAAAAWAFQKLRGKKGGTRPAAGGRVQTVRTGTDNEVAERTRRVQEDVRRKIAERRAAASSQNIPPRQAPEGNLPRRSSRSASEDGPPLVIPRVSAEREPDDEAAEFARQQKLQDQMRALDSARQAAAISAAASIPAGPAGLPPLNPWLAELRDPNGVRRAILLREILGPPISLRKSA